MFGIPKISNEEYISTLTEINGVAPETWFLAFNRGKLKKRIYAFLVNSIGDTLQLVPIKKNKKVFSLDKENIINLSKEDYFSKTTCVVDDTHDHFNICLTNGNKYKTIIKKYIIDKNRRKKYKSFRKQFKKQSVFPQIMHIVSSAFIVLIVAIPLICDLNNYSPIKHAFIANELKSIVATEENSLNLKTVLKPYDKAHLKLEENSFTTVEHGAIRLNIPSEYHISSDEEVDDFSVTYTNDLEKEQLVHITIDYEPLDYTYSDNEMEEKTRQLYKTVSPTTKREFGFPIQSQYDYMRATYMADVNNINYWNYKEVALYYVLMIMKTSLPTTCQHLYDIKTETYSGFIMECEPTSVGIFFVQLSIFPNNNLDLQYTITVMCGDVNEAYKILNSVELIEE